MILNITDIFFAQIELDFNRIINEIISLNPTAEAFFNQHLETGFPKLWPLYSTTIVNHWRKSKAGSAKEFFKDSTKTYEKLIEDPSTFT